MVRLLAALGGPGERARWAGLLARGDLRVVPAASARSPRVERAAKAGRGALRGAQADALAAGDALRALSLTANRRALASLAARGVRLEAVAHRPVWLAGA